LPCWLCCGLQLLGETKGWFEGQSLNFFPECHAMAVIILTISGQNYPSVAPTSQGGFWGHRVEAFCFCTLVAILDPLQHILYSV
jgi:hypothetical protein